MPETSIKSEIGIETVQKLDIRIGTVVEATPARGARVPALRLKIDFGEVGIKTSSAQITDHYSSADLLGQQVICVVNFPPRQIGNFMSEVLVMGGYEESGAVRLLRPDGVVKNGTRLR